MRKRYRPEFVLPMLDEHTWRPAIDHDALEIFDRCESLLEVVYLWGGFLSMREAWWDRIGEEMPIHASGAGWWIPDPWRLFDDDGPSALVIRPQVSRGRIRHDFVLYDGPSNSPETAIRPWLAVEIDGWNAHRRRRKDDAARDAASDLSVLRVREEEIDPRDWWALARDKW